MKVKFVVLLTLTPCAEAMVSGLLELGRRTNHHWNGLKTQGQRALRSHLAPFPTDSSVGCAAVVHVIAVPLPARFLRGAGAQGTVSAVTATVALYSELV